MENKNYESHSFSVELASEIGLEDTLILGHLYHWCVGNADNQEMFKDGHVWLYITRKRINDKYPYITESKIKGAINRLEEKGFIIVSNYNKLKIDKTNWYALTDKAYKLYGTSLDKIANRWLNSPSDGENSQAIQPVKQNYIDKDKDNNKKEQDWRTDFNAYYQMVIQAQDELLLDREFQNGYAEFNPNVDYCLTLKKMIVNYWGSEIGWKKKKSTRSKEINMLSTLKKGFENPLNKVYKQNKFGKQSEPIKSKAPIPKNFTFVPLNPELKFIDEEGKLNDGTFVKEGYRYYFSNRDGQSYSIPPATDPMPEDSVCEYDGDLGWYEIS